jgi:hypothetical protein
MSRQNYGPDVSQNPTNVAPGAGQFTAEDHSFDTVICQAGKTPVDWEFNLLQEILNPQGFKKIYQPSGWINIGFGKSNQMSSIQFLSPDPPIGSTSNKFIIHASNAVVNGWPIRFEYSNSSSQGSNIIQLPNPPLSGNRIDVVILEVWKALISGSPNSTNKSPSGQIYRHGNVKSPDSPNANLADDIVDVILSQETSKRVQIQYRYRVIQGVDLDQVSDGISSSINARSISYKGSSDADGESTVLSYQKSSIDPGLWVAGTGSVGDQGTLGTVDGFMYSIPICAISRRNSSSFNRSSNMNGGGLQNSSNSGRPDGLFSDQIIEDDVLDMRKSLINDYSEILQKSVQQVLDSNMRTRMEIIPGVGGGTRFTSIDSISSLGSFGRSDSVRTSFSERSVTESVVCGGFVSGVTSFQISLSSLPIMNVGVNVNVLSLAPQGVSIVGIDQVRLSQGITEDSLVIPTLGGPEIKSAVITTVTGPGPDTITLNFSSAVTGTIKAEILIEYPSKNGSNKNIYDPIQFWTPPTSSISAWVDPSILSNTSDSNRKSLFSDFWWVNRSHRELTVKLKSIQVSDSYFHNAGFIYIPDTITGDVTIDDGVNPSYTTNNYTRNTNYTRVQLNFTGGVTSVDASWTSLRPIPPLSSSPGDSYDLFYKTNSVQSISVPSGDQVVSFIPRVVSDSIYSISCGPASPDEPYPYILPGSMIPIGQNPPSSFPEGEMCAPCVSYSGSTELDNGFSKSPTIVDIASDPESFTLRSSTLDSRIDGDGRHFWSRSNVDPTSYSPVIRSEESTKSYRHKSFHPMIMELAQDYDSIGRKGDVFLVVISKYYPISKSRDVDLSSSVSSSSASVFRIKGRPMASYSYLEADNENTRRSFFGNHSRYIL